MVGGQPGIPQHDRGDNGKAGNYDLAGGTVIRAKPEQHRKRNTGVKRIALVKAKRTRRIAKNILEEEKTADRQCTNECDDRCGRSRRVTAEQGHILVHCVRTPSWCRWSGSNRHSFWEHDFESCASANSATPAERLAIPSSRCAAKQKCGCGNWRHYRLVPVRTEP